MRVKDVGLTGFTRRHAKYMLGSALAVAAVNWALVDGAYAQGLPPAALVNGQTVQGNLGDANDTVLPDGRPVDRYVVTAQAPNQAYSVEASSPEIPVVSTVSYLDPAGGLVGIQRANVFAAGQKVLYAGALPQAGRYLVNIYSADAQQPVGTYTLSLCRDNDDDDDDDDLDDLDDCLDDDVLDDDNGLGVAPGGGVVGAPAPGGQFGDDDDDDRFDDDFDDRFDD